MTSYAWPRKCSEKRGMEDLQNQGMISDSFFTIFPIFPIFRVWTLAMLFQYTISASFIYMTRIKTMIQANPKS
jgi:hypothetical protein